MDMFSFCRMYLEGSGRRFLLSAKSFDVGKYYISSYEGFPNIDTKPKCGYVAKVERQRDLSFTVSLDYCHLCDERRGKFCCGRSKTEREVVAKIAHSVKRYRKVNMEFRCITVTIPLISKSGRRRVWCPRSFREVNPDLPNSADVNEALRCTPKMGMRLVSKLPEWNEEANNLVVRFQGSGRILVASAKNFLLYEEKKAGPDLAELSMSHLEDQPPARKNNNPQVGDNRDRVRTSSMEPIDRSDSGQTDGADVDIEGGVPSPGKSPQMASLTNKNIQKLKLPLRAKGTAEGVQETDPTGDEASRSSKNSSRRDRSVKSDKTSKDRSKSSDTGSVQGGATKVRKSRKVRTGDADSTPSVSPKVSPRPTAEKSPREKKSPRDSGTTCFLYPLSVSFV